MTTTKERLLKIPVVSLIVKLLEKIKVPGLVGMTLYDVFEMYVIGIVQGALTSRAGAVAFSFFMALFPFALFVLTLIPFVPIENFDTIFMEFINQALPPKTYEAVDTVLNDIANNRYGGLLSFGFIMSIFLMTNGINSLFGGFEYSYHKLETRSIIKQYMVSLMVSIIVASLLFITVGAIIYFEIAVGNLTKQGYVSNGEFWNQVGRYAIIFSMLLTTVSIFYYLGAKEGKQIAFFSVGAVFTSILIVLNFKLFGIYVRKFAKYNELYGSIGTLLVLMLFIWLNSIILLLGFELNASLIRLKKRNKT